MDPGTRRELLYARGHLAHVLDPGEVGTNLARPRVEAGHFHEPTAERDVPPRGPFGLKLHLGPDAAGPTETRSQLGRVGEPSDRPGQGLRIPGRDEQPGRAILDEGRDAANRG